MIGKFYSITLIPKKRISFTKIIFPNVFNRLGGSSIGHNVNSEGKVESVGSTSYKVFEDRYGLNYSIYESGYAAGDAEESDQHKGDLLTIEYEIPKKIEETIFVKENQ